MRNHPYRTAPARAFWSRSVASNWNPADLISENEHLIRKDDVVMSAGSCFAANIAPYLTRAGLKYLRTEQPHPDFANGASDNFGYDKYSAAYGNIYTARQLLQLLDRSIGAFKPAEDRWQDDTRWIDPFRPGLRYPAGSEREFDVLTQYHLAKTKEAFERADVFIFTLGLTEAWVSTIDGAVFPVCPGTVSGQFSEERHEFKNFSVDEVASDLVQFVVGVRKINPKLKIILTVSSVPLTATATNDHVLSATIYSKSVLRVACELVTKQQSVRYFPAYEIVTGPQAPDNFFSPDRRSVTKMAVDTVMHALLSHCEAGSIGNESGAISPKAQVSELAGLVERYECEEQALDNLYSYER